MTGELEGRVALVTGGASGIGRASALAFAQHGAGVIVADVAAEQGRATVDLIATAGGEAIYVPADVTRRGDVERLVRTAVERFGRLDCAHNNAGIEGVPSAATESHTYPEELWDQVLSINLRASGYACRPKSPRCSRRAAEPSSTRPPSPVWSAALVWPTVRPSMGWSG